MKRREGKFVVDGFVRQQKGRERIILLQERKEAKKRAHGAEKTLVT